MITRLGWLILGTVTFWVVLAVPARRLWGDETAVAGALAALLCLVPTALTFLAAAAYRTPQQQVIATLVGSGVCMFAVLGGMVGVMHLAPEFQERTGFWVWLLVFYLFTLALKMVVLLRGRAAAVGMPPPEVPSPAGRA